MQVHHKPTKILIGGKSGSGKTTYLIRYVQNSNYQRYFIYDHKMEFHNRLGIPPCYSFAECAEYLKRGERNISYNYADEFPGAVEDGFQAFSEWCYEVCKAIEATGDGAAGNSLFVCDEVNRFTTPSDLGFGFKQLIEDGRLNGIDLIATSHAQNQISNRLRLQLSEIVALKTQDGRPLMFLEEEGFDPVEVQSLPTGSYIVKDMERETFTRGKLFTCAPRREEVEEPKDDQTPAPTTEEPHKPLEPQSHVVSPP